MYIYIIIHVFTSTCIHTHIYRHISLSLSLFLSVGIIKDLSLFLGIMHENPSLSLLLLTKDSLGRDLLRGN